MQELSQHLNLAARLADVIGRISVLASQSPNETKTRYTIIDPILDALGWDPKDPRLVEPEYITLSGKPVDYALMRDDGQPVVFIEAKKLHGALDGDREAAQVIAYAATDGVERCVLTNGQIWNIYNTLQPGPAPMKLVAQVRLDSNKQDPNSLIEAAKAIGVLRRATLFKSQDDPVAPVASSVPASPFVPQPPVPFPERWGNIPANVRVLYQEIVRFCHELAPSELEFGSVKRYDVFRLRGTGAKVFELIPREKHLFLWTVCRAPFHESLPAFARRYPETAEEPNAIRMFLSSPDQLPYAKERIKFALNRVKQG